MRKLKQILGWVIVIAVAVAVGGWLVSLFSDNKEQLVFNTVKAELMDMRKTISATGTVEPEELINVGAQVGGMITSFGVDVDGNNVDYRSKVTENMVLANIDGSRRYRNRQGKYNPFRGSTQTGGGQLETGSTTESSERYPSKRL